MQQMRTANMINGTAPAKAWVGNLAAVAVRPLTSLSGAVALGAKTGNFKNLQTDPGWSWSGFRRNSTPC